jgi:hypothetical protein
VAAGNIYGAICDTGGQVLNVKCPPYNAKGDWNGTTGTDDTDAIERALEAANGLVVGIWETGGDTTISARRRVPVFFPPGQYRTTRTIPIRYSGVSLLGIGTPISGGSVWSGYTSMIVGDHAGDVLSIDASGSYVPYYTSIEGLHITKAAKFGSVGHCVSVSGGNWLTGISIHRSRMRGCQDGLHIGPGSGTIGKVSVQYSGLENNAGYGFYSAQALTTGTITHSGITQNGAGGIHSAGKGLTIADNDLEGQPNPLVITGTNNTSVQIRNNYFEANTGAAAIVLGLTHGFVVEQNQWGPNVNIPKVLVAICDNGRIDEDSVHMDAGYNVTYRRTIMGSHSSVYGIAHNLSTSRLTPIDSGVPTGAIVPVGNVLTQIGSQFYRSASVTSAPHIVSTPVRLSFTTGDYVYATYAVKYTSTLPNIHHSIRFQASLHSALGWVLASNSMSVTLPVNEVRTGDVVLYAFGFHVLDPGPFDQIRLHLYPFGQINDVGTGAYVTNAYVWRQSDSVIAQVNPLGLIQNALDSLPGGSIDSCMIYTVASAALTAPVAIQDITLFTLPATAILTGLRVKHSTSFSGGGLTGMTVSIGVSGAPAYYSSAYSVFQAVSDINEQFTTLFTSHDARSHDVLARFTATGGAVNAAVTGLVDITACWVKP